MHSLSIQHLCLYSGLIILLSMLESDFNLQFLLSIHHWLLYSKNLFIYIQYIDFTLFNSKSKFLCNCFMCKWQLHESRFFIFFFFFIFSFYVSHLYIIFKGNNTVNTRCALPLPTQYVKTTCSQGSTYNYGINTIFLPCAKPSLGYSITTDCFNGDNNFIGAQTVFNCSAGYFGIPLVVNNTFLEGCSSCQPGYYSNEGDISCTRNILLLYLLLL